MPMDDGAELDDVLDRFGFHAAGDFCPHLPDAGVQLGKSIGQIKVGRPLCDGHLSFLVR